MPSPCPDILRPPDRVTAFGNGGPRELSAGQEGVWRNGDVEVVTTPGGGVLPVQISAPQTALHRIKLRWQTPVPPQTRLLGDHWERGYGDLEWRGLMPERVMPWYVLLHDGTRTHGLGVKTGVNALCFWQADSAGVTLWLDVRNGGGPVELGERVLDAATVVVRPGREGETAFAAGQAFCRLLCDDPRLPAHPVYGGNNWYHAYGNSAQQAILEDTRRIASLAPGGDNRPYMVIDDGWQLCRPTASGGPWYEGNRRFPDMPGLAARMKSEGVRPGLWVRPLLTVERVPDAWALPGRASSEWGGAVVLDPTVPDALAHIAEDIARLVGWGYELIKHDFSTFDLLGRWGFAMGAEVTDGGWRFADRSRTTAEVILDFYRTLRAASGDALLLGCNTVGHLGAGLLEIQRTGDDTSGRDWGRTRRMGVNTLAFRMPQHEAFFAVDADCVGLTNAVPWEFNRQWLDLLARSGTPLFVSAAPDAVGPLQERALKEAFAAASQPQPPGEPLDWLDTTCPGLWHLSGEETQFDWFGAEGASPFRE